MPTVLSELAARGVTLTIDDTSPGSPPRLLARPKSRLDEHARRLIAANRAALTVTLANRQTLAVFVDCLNAACPAGDVMAADTDFWAAMQADIDRHADAEAPAAFARRVARWRAGAAERFRSFFHPTADAFPED